MDYRDNRQRWAESHQVVHFYAGQWCTFTPALTGWSMANHLRTRLVLDALDMALWQRRPDGVVHHSDSEYLRAGSLGVT